MSTNTLYRRILQVSQSVATLNLSSSVALVDILASGSIRHRLRVSPQCQASAPERDKPGTYLEPGPRVDARDLAPHWSSCYPRRTSEWSYRPET